MSARTAPAASERAGLAAPGGRHRWVTVTVAGVVGRLVGAGAGGATGRELTEGMRGADVAQLNHDLVALGYAGAGYIAGPGWDYFSWDTRYGLEQLQAKLGLEQTGSLPLGQGVFEPRALRVATVRASLGAGASGPVFSATSARHVVSISLDAADQSEVTTGDPVTITL